MKRLTLKGFKSFAETTVFDLEPGISVIVGPNGSGKSNVVDAVAWVLGTQGPSTVRSQKMEDVIFAGSAARPALGRAEVSLTLDNVDGRLPIDLAEVTVTRTLWRSGESEYAINQAPCRLLDISELLSDSGVGRSQHVIVGQGGLDGVLSGRPEDRRVMIEEAAGILKYRRRRERTERRIAATEGDLARLQDLAREVRAQLRPLQRQADAAERHDGIVAEARAIRIYLAGRELRTATELLASAHNAAAQAGARLSGLRVRLAELDEQIGVADAALAAETTDSEEGLIGSLERLGERAKGLAALVGERQRSLRRSLEAMVDEGAVEALASETDRIRAALGDADVVAASLSQERARLEAEEAALEADRRAALEAQGGDLALEARRAGEGAKAAPQGPDLAGSGSAASRASVGELRGRRGAIRAGLDRDRSELDRARVASGALGARLEELAAALATRRAAVEELEEAVLRVAAGLAARQGAIQGAEELAGRAAAELRDAEADQQRWQARADALGMALGQLRARGGAAHLAGSPGLLGTLAEMVVAEPGWEAGFEAALGPTFAAVVFDEVAGAVGALERLERAQAAGLVIAVPQGLERVDLEGGLAARASASNPPVRAILAQALAGFEAVSGGWREALALALAHPGATFVTRHGDRFGPDGWRVGDPGLGATGAALEEARSRAGIAAGLVVEAASKVAETSSELDRARQTGDSLVRERDSLTANLARAQRAMAEAEARWVRATSEAAAGVKRAELLARRVERDTEELGEIEVQLAVAETEAAAAAERDRRWSETQRGLLSREAELRGRRQELEVRAAAVEERGTMLAGRLGEIERRLARMVVAREDEADRRARLERAEVVTARLGGMVRGTQARIASELEGLRAAQAAKAARRGERIAALGALRAARVGLEAELGDAQAQGHHADLVQVEAGFRQRAALEAVQAGLGVEPELALAWKCPELPAGVSAEDRAAELDRQLRLAGPVNPLAAAELEVVKERAGLLDAQLADVLAARDELAKLGRAIDAERVGVFATAYDDVARHFAALVGALFAGGEGSLCLTDPENLLETGIEVRARPEGKKIRSISLLSGGERSLVALAFLFAIFRSRPSPFYLLDEVEAALDDVNLQRFLDLIGEFRADAQLIIVSHQRRTMEVADCLYGISMAAGASSRVVSERTSGVTPG